MKKINSRGFALVEMVIVSAFVMGLLTLMYTNFYPMMGEYEKRENYDNIESVYKTYLVKKMVELRRINLSLTTNTTEFTCDNIVDKSGEYCKQLVEELGIEKMYIASYNSPGDTSDSNLNSYIDTITPANGSFDYRIIVKYKVTIDIEGSKTKRDVYQYSSMGVNINET